MKIILLEDVDGLGYRGDVVEAKVGFASNYLIPSKKAVLVSLASMNRLKKEMEEVRIQNLKNLEEAEALSSQMSGLLLTFKRRTAKEDKLFGSVTASDVASELAQKGFDVDKKKIHLSSVIHELGTFPVKVRLFREVWVTIQVEVVPEEF